MAALRIRRAVWLIITACGAVWVICAISPYDRQTWALEQIATLLVATALWASRETNYSTTALFGLGALFCVHTIGTHYTYSLTPYNDWLTTLFGTSLNDVLGWQRNHYDRFVHLLWGVCLTQPFREYCMNRLSTSARTADHLSLHLVLSTSAGYELLEWTAALVFGDGGTAYLGTQGDPWDAQSDIAISVVGWLLVMLACRMRRHAG